MNASATCRLCRKQDRGALPRMFKYSTRHYAHPACLLAPGVRNGPVATSVDQRPAALAKFFRELPDWALRRWPVPLTYACGPDVRAALDAEVERRWPDGLPDGNTFDQIDPTNPRDL